METNKEEPLMPIRPETDFQKLLWERHHNNELRKKIVELEKSLSEQRKRFGELTSDFQEFKYLAKQSGEAGAIAVKITGYKKQMKAKDESIKKLKREVDELVRKLALKNLNEKDK